MKKITKYLILFILVFAIPKIILADGVSPKQPDKSSAFGKKEFSNSDSFGKKSGDVVVGARTSSSTTDSTGAPIPGGVVFLLTGGVLYFYRKEKVNRD